MPHIGTAGTSLDRSRGARRRGALSLLGSRRYSQLTDQPFVKLKPPPQVLPVSRNQYW